MATINELLSQLQTDKNNLVANLVAKGVEASTSETFTSLVPKVLAIFTGVDTSDATATAGDIAVGKTAYVAEGKITGTKEADVQNVKWKDGVVGSLDTQISAYGFAEYIDTIKIPIGITVVYDGAASPAYCPMFDGISHIILSSTVVEIGKCAFASSASTTLISIFIPKSVKSFGVEAFAYTKKLEHIYYEGTEEEWNDITKGSGWNYSMGSNVSGGTTIHYNYVPE